MYVCVCVCCVVCMCMCMVCGVYVCCACVYVCMTFYLVFLIKPFGLLWNYAPVTEIQFVIS